MSTSSVIFNYNFRLVLTIILFHILIGFVAIALVFMPALLTCVTRVP